jgi:putative transposase
MGMSLEVKYAMIETNHQELSIRKQCQLLGLNRSNIYYEAKGESEENICLMKLLDEEYTRHPFKGVRRMTVYLREFGYLINEKRVRRLLRLMGIEAIYPKRNLSKSNAEHKKYPYLLKGLAITKPNQVWCTDITYIRLSQGFVYLIAIMDWYSRYVLGWRLSNSLESSFCVEALEDALIFHGVPEIFNTDQGSQFTSEGFTGLLLANAIKISMDAKGRAFDNIFIERLWRSVKYEEVYLHDYNSVIEAKTGLKKYFNFYNFERHHQHLGYKKPAEIYFNKVLPVHYVNSVDNSLLVPRKVTHRINMGTQAQ